MALSTSTSTLAAGASRTFNLSPGSALTIVAPPNVRATVTETPNTVSASDVGGNASRTHNLQMVQTVTYGPYEMGGTVVVDNAINSGATITWVRSDSIVAESAAGALSLVSGDGTEIPIGSSGGVPSAFTSRALTDSDNGDVLVCGSSQTATVNTGLTSGFGCSFKGTIAFDGTATVTDVRTTGASNPWCALVQTGTDTYDVVGSKA